MPNVSNVSTGKPKLVGAVFFADVGTTLPTDATSALDAGFSDLGFVSEDGVTNSNTPETDDIKAWGGQVVLTVQTSKPDEFKLTLIESLNSGVLKVVYGDDNVTVDGGTGAITVQATAAEQEEHSFVITMALRGGATRRIVIPNGKLKEVGDVVYKDDEAIGYEITLAALPNGSGVTHYEYTTPNGGSGFTAIALDKSTASVVHGNTTTLVATTTPAGGRVSWATSDATKATVNSSGVVTGVAAGSAVITAMCNGLAASCTVTVT